MTAPVIIAVCMILYYITGAIILFKFDIPAVIKISAGIFSTALAVVFIAVLAERIKEIHQGEEDDLGKY